MIADAPQRLRWQVFASIYFGYAGYYLVRSCYKLAMPDIMRAYPQHDEVSLGWGLTAISTAYGFSKFLMGSVSDRSNPRWFMALGLTLAAGTMLILGLSKAWFASLPVLIAMITLSSWGNGMGWAPCGKTMVHWWDRSERGRIVSLWNLAHNLGGGTAAPLAAWGVAYFHDWSATFYVNASVALIIAMLIAIFLRDVPEPTAQTISDEPKLSFRELFMQHVLPNKLLWSIAAANIFIYFVRYGVLDWVPTYLEKAKGFSKKEAGLAWLCFEYAAIPGTLLCGWASDRWFRSRRAPATILFMVPCLLGMIVYAANIHGPLSVDIAALIVIGFFIYGPVMMIGLQALELVDKRAAGTAAGLTGFFGYVLGTAPAGVGIGWLAKHWGWPSAFTAIIVSCVLAMLCCLPTLRVGAPKA
jgi:MFS transporter, OPA family, glycerol-3-phosphate transporter